MKWMSIEKYKNSTELYKAHTFGTTYTAFFRRVYDR